MKITESYKGVRPRFHYDHCTGTYLGILDGLAIATSLQTANNNDLVEAFYEAVDTYGADRFLMTCFQARLEREEELQPAAKKEASADFAADDLFSHRQFLR